MSLPASLTVPGPLVDVDWLAAAAAHPDLVLLDASWHMPATGRNGFAEFGADHLPGARFFDFDTVIKDHHSSLPHMLPPTAEFEAAVRGLGVKRGSAVVCYDSVGLFASPRAWWLFRAMGHDNVAVLDGGLPAWRAAGRSTVAGETQPSAPGDFRARPDPRWLADLAAVRAACATGSAAILDARSPGRFAAQEPEPRPGLRGGHMPGARNLPFGRLLDGGVLRPPADLRALFAECQVAEETPLICSCGSGVSACVIALAATVIGKGNVAVYDGSWTEWGGRQDTPVVGGVSP
jgi:thiosulfate/3-mercaptopyruvate sulfurtransferase